MEQINCILKRKIIIIYDLQKPQKQSHPAAIDAFNASHFDAIVIPKALRHDASSNLVANELEIAAFA